MSLSNPVEEKKQQMIITQRTNHLIHQIYLLKELAWPFGLLKTIGGD
jgi:hypothetical protein